MEPIGKILATLLVGAALLAAPTMASADTAFGGDPTQVITPGVGCENAAAIYVPTWRAPTCAWWWTHINVGSDIVPLPITGGSGLITSVTLPAMPNPGTMQVVILTSALSATNEPSRPQFICCQIKQLGPTFTVPANQVATVPQSLAVSNTKEADLTHPGETSFGDIAAISVLTPGASLPLRYTARTSLNSADGGDVDEAYFPAPVATSGEFTPSVDPGGFEVLARYTLGSAPAPTPAPGPAPAPTPGPPAGGGLKLGDGPVRLGADGKTVTLGKATNPPTATTTQTLTAPGGGARVSAAGKKPKKPAVLGAGKTTVPAGKTVALTLKLNGEGRAALHKRGKLTATLTIIATNAQGEAQTQTRQVTIKPAPKKKKRR